MTETERHPDPLEARKAAAAAWETLRATREKSMLAAIGVPVVGALAGWLQVKLLTPPIVGAILLLAVVVLPGQVIVAARGYAKARDRYLRIIRDFGNEDEIYINVEVDSEQSDIHIETGIQSGRDDDFHAAIGRVEADIAKAGAQVIVNAWNCNYIPWFLLLPKGVSKSIRKAAGHQPFWDAFRLGPMRPGSVIDTKPGRMKCYAIYHVAGLSPWWTTNERIIRRATRECVTLAVIQGYHSIALPLIGSGTGGFDPDRAQAIIEAEIKSIANLRLIVYIVRYPGPQGNQAANPRV